VTLYFGRAGGTLNKRAIGCEAIFHSHACLSGNAWVDSWAWRSGRSTGILTRNASEVSGYASSLALRAWCVKSRFSFFLDTRQTTCDTVAAAKRDPVNSGWGLE